MIKKITFILILTFLLLEGCGIPQEKFDKLELENNKLKEQLAENGKELEDCKFGAEKLYDKAISYYENKEFVKSSGQFQILRNKHPESKEAKASVEVLKKINLELSNILKAKNKIETENEKERIKAKKDELRKEKQRLTNATSKMRKKYDDINETTWYRDKTSPQYTNYNGFFAYIGKKGNRNPWLRLRIQYAADDWLFIEKYIIKVDEKTYTITEEKYGEIEQDNGSGGIWEWLDRTAEKDEYEIIKAVANGKIVKIRFIGKQYHKDKTITSRQKTALRNVLDAYEALGGSIK